MFEGLRTVVYTVTDLPTAKAWYAGVLNQQPYFDEPFYVGFNVGGYELGLLPAGESEPAPGVAVTYWGVADADAAYAHLIAQGASPYLPVADVGGDIRLGAVKDASGNVVGVVYNPHFVAG